MWLQIKNTMHSQNNQFFGFFPKFYSRSRSAIKEKQTRRQSAFKHIDS